MTVQLNHTIVPARNKKGSATFLSEILGLPEPYSPLGLPHDEMEPDPSVPNDPDARPALDEMLELRANRIDCPNDSAPGSASVSRVMTRRPSGSSTTPNPNGTSPR